MKRTFLVAVLALALPALSHAQLPEPLEGLGNPNIVAGAGYLSQDPGAGLHRTQFLLTANLAGVKVGTLPVYVGGVGIDLRTVDNAFGEISGVGLSVPLVTAYFKGDQFLAQVGWATDLTGDPKSKAFYVGLGFSFTSPNQMAAKRAAKKGKK
jgi:hypothetical protein